MFLESITANHVGLSMREMSMMGMTQIGAQVIITRKNINKKNTVQAKIYIYTSSHIRIAVG